MNSQIRVGPDLLGEHGVEPVDPAKTRRGFERDLRNIVLQVHYGPGFIDAAAAAQSYRPVASHNGAVRVDGGELVAQSKQRRAILPGGLGQRQTLDGLECTRAEGDGFQKRLSRLVAMAPLSAVLADCERRAAGAPDDPERQAEIGEILLKLAKFAEAAAVFERVEALDPDCERWRRVMPNSADLHFLRAGRDCAAQAPA